MTSDEIVDAANAVFDGLGPGLSEHAYQSAMEVELSSEGLQFTTEAIFVVLYRGQPVAFRRPDLLVADDETVVVELKVGGHRNGEAQLESYIVLGERDENISVDTGMLISFEDEVKVVQNDGDIN